MLFYLKLFCGIVLPVLHSCVFKADCRTGSFSMWSADERGALACRLHEWHTHRTSLLGVTQGRHRGRASAPAQRHCGRCSWSRGEGWLSGEHHTGPTLDLAPCCCAVHCSWLKGPSWQHLPQRLRHLPWAWGGGSSLSSQARCRGPQTWTGAVVHRQTQRTQPRRSRSCCGAGRSVSRMTLYWLQGD